MGYYVCFENEGEVPINAFKLLGASTKRDDESKIGFFGTGLKYAVAVLLREGVDFKIFSGEKEVVISTRKTKFINEDVHVMTVNGEKTSITLDAGIDWEPWFAIREIYSNTLDENGKMTQNAKVEPVKGKTRIFVDIENPSLSELFKNWESYFSSARTPLVDKFRGKMFNKLPAVPQLTIFRKGIRVHTEKMHSLFDYDLDNIEINESRVIKYRFYALGYASDILAQAGEDEIRTMVELYKHPGRTEFIEWKDEFWEFAHQIHFTGPWLQVLDDRKVIPANFAGYYEITEECVVLPDKLIEKLKQKFGNSIRTMNNATEKYTLIENFDKSPIIPHLSDFSKVGLKFSIDDIDVVKFKDKDIMGMSKDKRVQLSEDLFSPMGQSDVSVVLLEEIVHAKTGFNDNSRQMQDYLFGALHKMIKKAIAN